MSILGMCDSRAMLTDDGQTACTACSPSPTRPCAWRGGVRGGGHELSARSERIVNRFHHASRLPQHFVVPEAQDAVSARRQELSSRRIVRYSLHFAVLAAVHLDDQPLLVATKVSEVGTDR